MSSLTFLGRLNCGVRIFREEESGKLVAGIDDGQNEIGEEVALPRVQVDQRGDDMLLLVTNAAGETSSFLLDESDRQRVGTLVRVARKMRI